MRGRIRSSVIRACARLCARRYVLSCLCRCVRPLTLSLRSDRCCVPRRVALIRPNIPRRSVFLPAYILPVFQQTSLPSSPSERDEEEVRERVDGPGLSAASRTLLLLVLLCCPPAFVMYSAPLTLTLPSLLLVLPTAGRRPRTYCAQCYSRLSFPYQYICLVYHFTACV